MTALLTTSKIKGTYHSIPRPHFGKSDHKTVLLLPAYKQILKRENPAKKVVQCWSEETEELLRDCLETVDWSIFKNSAPNLNEYATTVTDSISKYVDDCVPKKTVRTFPNRKPWLNREIDSLLKDRSEAFKSDDPDLYRKSRYDLHKAIRDAKREYQTKLESQTDSRRLWQGLNNTTGYKVKPSSISGSSAPLPDELNAFYARFEQVTNNPLSSAPAAHNSPIPTEVRSAFLKVNPRKATGPDGTPGRALRACADQLAEMFGDIFNLSLLHSKVPTCFNKTTIIPVPKKNQATCLNDYRPLALTSVVMKCFERLVMKRITSILLERLDPLQFAYHRNRSTADAISLALHPSLEHLDNKNSYIRLLFIDYSSAFNTIIPAKLISKLQNLGLGSPLCNWILDFLTHRPQ
ncbi:uncharacterized protein [Scyliorhinus torazame]|uniref:uncharacterized protein n=1 Tax=Scyliorhinus torazame TaxID=75743 RepID=UPI003B5AB6C9